MRVYLDSDVLIWHLRGNKQALKLLNRLAGEQGNILCIGAMQRAEVLFFMRPEEEEQTLLFLSRFTTVPVDQEIVETAGLLYRTWNRSHGIDTNDSILAATVMKTGGKIICLNIKHYPMPDVTAERGWN